MLHTSAVRRTAHFFEAGGNSIKAIKLINTVKKNFSVDFEFKQFFANPTFESLTELIKSGKRNHSSDIQKVQTEEFYELSNSQKRLWVLGKLMEDSAVYNIPLAVRIKGEIDYPRLNNAFKALIANTKCSELHLSNAVANHIKRYSARSGRMNLTMQR